MCGRASNQGGPASALDWLVQLVSILRLRLARIRTILTPHTVLKQVVGPSVEPQAMFPEPAEMMPRAPTFPSERLT